MTSLHQMSYEDFGKLRFLEFFPKTDAYHEDHEGGMETGIGIACTEGYQWTMFTSPMNQPWQTAEICLEFGNDCPTSEGHALLDALGLPLRKGMTTEQVKSILGTPQRESPGWPVFVLGHTQPFYVGCLIIESGLLRVWIARKDLADAEDEKV